MANKVSFKSAAEVVAHAIAVMSGEIDFSMREDERLAIARGKFQFNVKEHILLQQYDSFVFPMITEAHNREARRHKLWL